MMQNILLTVVSMLHRFEGACMRYRNDLPLVLRKVTFTIKPKEKIGIVGRTGSGAKSRVKCCVTNLTETIS